jgi:acetyl-CoA carboxylase biotin carboxyl carrier protein
MNLDEIKDLIDTVIAKGIAELEYSNGDERIRICRASSVSQVPPSHTVVVASTPGPVAAEGANSAPAKASEAAAKTAESNGDLLMVTAPIVGTFYESPSPGSPPFVELGDRVESGQILCIIEAMKLMNEIEAENAGVVAKRFVSNGQPVEYGEALFAIRPD